MRRRILAIFVVMLMNSWSNVCGAQQMGDGSRPQRGLENTGHLTVTTKQLLPSKSLGVSQPSPLILGLADPSDFRSPNFNLRVSKDTVQLTKTGSVSKFAEMADRRNDVEANLRGERAKCLDRFNGPVGGALSNVGVSLAVNISLQGDEYALLAYRAGDDRFMLLSGYVEASEDPVNLPQLFMKNVIREANEELLAIGGDGLPFRCVVVTNDTPELLKKAYSSLTYSPEAFQLVQSDLPRYLHNLYPSEYVECDGQKLQAGFQYSRQWNSGQLIIAFRLKFDNGSEPHWLFHAEDQLDTTTGTAQLVTMLSRDNLVLAKLNDQGRITPRFYRLISGELKPFELDLAESWMSEAFSLPGTDLKSGVIEKDRIRMSDYLAWP